MEQEDMPDTIGQARHSLSRCNNKREDGRQRENSTDEEGGEVQEKDWNENYECDSNISYFEDELDRLLDPEENKDCWTEPSETVDSNGTAVTETRGREDSLSNGTEVIELRVGSDSPPCRTSVTETRGREDSPPKATVSSQSRVWSPPPSSLIDSDFKEELDRLLDQEEDEDSWTEPSETVDGNDTPSNGTDSSQPRVRGSSPLSTEASESSEEDEDDLSFETEAIETRASKKRKNISSPKAEEKKGRKKARPTSSPLWISSPAKSRRNAHAATPLIIGSERRWRTEDEPDQEPKLFPFEPARTPGPQLDTSKNYTVLELFQLFFSNDVVDTLCSNTNKNAKRRQEQGIKEPWKPVSVEEMYNYLSIVIYMGLLNVHTVSDYWEERGEEHKEQPSEQRVEKQGEKQDEKQDEKQGEKQDEKQGEKQGEEEEEVEVGLLCCPVPTKDPITVALCNKASEGRRQCHLCKHKTIWQCESCKVALCIIPDRNCFRIWHVKKDNDEQD
ncbi:unnamed protein product [Coregonus sp. 'balchen']|nr:unnamed protein product [Coregonus sp. 'balchen']